MKKILSSLVVAILCTTLSAQEKLDFFGYVEDVIGNKLSLSQFIEKYKPYFTDDYDESTSSVGLKNLDIFGYDGGSLTMFMPEYNVKILTVTPDYETLDSVSRYESAEKCHKEMVKRFGKPIKQETNSYDDPVKQEIAQKMNMKGGVTYTWKSNDNVLLTSIWTKTDKEDVYLISFMSMELLFNKRSSTKKILQDIRVWKIHNQTTDCICIGNQFPLHIRRKKIFRKDL